MALKVIASQDLLEKAAGIALRDSVTCREDEDLCESCVTARYRVYEDGEDLIFEILGDAKECEIIARSKYSGYVSTKLGYIHGHTHGALEPEPSGVDTSTFYNFYRDLVNDDIIRLNPPKLYLIASATLVNQREQRYSIAYTVKINFYTVLLDYSYRVEELELVKLIEIDIDTSSDSDDYREPIFLAIENSKKLYIHGVYIYSLNSKIPKDAFRGYPIVGVRGRVIDGRLSPLTQWRAGLLAAILGLDKVYIVDLGSGKAWSTEISSEIKPRIVHIASVDLRFSPRKVIRC